MAFSAGCSASVDTAEGDTGSTSEAVVASGPSAQFVTVRKAKSSDRCPVAFTNAVMIKSIGASSEVCTQLDLGPTQFDTNEAAAVTGDFAHHILKGRVLGTPGAFVVDGVWKSTQLAASIPGTLYAVRQTPIVCFAAPCRNIEQTNLKTGKVTMIAGVDVSRCAGDTSNAQSFLASANGALAVGTTYNIRGAAGDAPGLRATTFIAPVVHVAPVVVDDGLKEGATCGGRGNKQCAEGLFCNFLPTSNCGMADGPGVCARKPDACIMLFKPVCGCDRVDHSNACAAANAGVTVLHDGPCTDADILH